MAKKETITIDIKNNADETAKDFDTLNKSIDNTTKSAKNLDATFEEVYGELQPLTTRMGEAEDRLYELALAGDTASKEYQELLTKVGEYRKVQIQTDIAVDGAATTMGQKLGSALTGATSGFAATQGAMALFGGESEALEKSLLKVQGALAIQQGVDGLRTSYKELGGATGLATKAQKALNFVMNLNPFVLIATAIGLAIAALLKFTDFLDPVIDKLKQFSDWIGITDFAEEERAAAREERHQAERQRIKEEKELREAAFNARQKQFDRDIAMLEAEGKSSFALRQKKIEDSLAVMKQKKLEFEQSLQILQSESEAVNRWTENVRNDYGKELIQINESIKDAENQLKINVKNNNKEKAASYKTYTGKVKKLAEDRQKADQDALDAEIDAEIKLLAELDKIRIENEARFNTDKENELLKVAEKYDVLKAMAQDNDEALKQIKIARLNENNEIELKYANEAYEAQKAIDDKAAADEKALNEKTKADALANQQAKVQFANDSLSAISGLVTSFAGESEKAQERAFKINKAIGITQAIINTAGAVTAAINPAVGGLGIPAGLPGALLAAATGAAQIATISKTQFQGGGSESIESPPSSVEAATPSFNVVGDSSVNQLAQLQATPTQAYVVSGEVTTSQALDRNRVQNATL